MTRQGFVQLSAIWDRLVRAEEHLEAIKGELLSYYRKPVHVMSGHYDPNDETALEIRALPVPLSVRLHTLVGEFLHDLRSALDHLAWQLVEQNGGIPTDKTSFPVLTRRPSTQRVGVASRPNIAGGVSDAARAVVHDAQPYQWDADSAAHPIWILNELWNIDKHRHVAIKGVRTDGFVIPDGIPAFSFCAEVASFGEHGAELVLVPDDSTVNVDARTTLRVMVREPREGIERDLYSTLEGIRMAVMTIVRDAEDRCF